MATSDLANMMMVSPYMFDTSQLSNRFSNYNDQRYPGPSYGGTPVNAATGQPIASYQQWLQQNPGGTTLNQTAAQPQAAQAPQLMNQSDFMARYMQAMKQAAVNPLTGVAADPNAFANAQYYRQMAQSMQPQEVAGPAGSGRGYSTVGYTHPPQTMWWQGPGPTGTPSAAPQGSGAPNNWNAALSALANPGNPVTPGATVPQVTGYQPAGGVNQAWLNQVGQGQGMNQNFVAALRAIQGR